MSEDSRARLIRIARRQGERYAVRRMIWAGAGLLAVYWLGRLAIYLIGS